MTHKEKYLRWKRVEERIQTLTKEKDVLLAAGDAAFREFEEKDRDRAYDEGDAAGWIPADRIEDEIGSLEFENKQLLSELVKHKFPFVDYESTGAYGLEVKKRVKVTFLDGREEVGLIYPWTYDQKSDDYWLLTSQGEVYLESWEVEKIELL